MKLKKLTSVLLALAMLTQLLPLSVFAGDSEEVLEEELLGYTITEEYTYTSADTTDNDALLEGYVEQLFGISDNDGIMLAATYTGEDAFANDAVNLPIYTALETAVEKIASGEESSSVVTITVSYAYSDLGTSSFSDAWDAFCAALDSQTIISYLLYDHPYELYWFDKTKSTSISYGASSSGTNLIVTVAFTFTVATGYQLDGSTTTVDSSKVTAAQAAVKNAQTIVSTYANYSNWDKLTAYKDEICSLTSYDGTTTEETPYGDIWQLVYVFDGDEETKVVCKGYSKAFQYLCDLSGLYCLTVSGYMAGGTGSGSHMWNVVYLDGVNYLVDVTNSDAGSVGQDGGLFMVDDEDAVQILDGTETYSYCYGYVFYVNNQTITYTYGSTTLALYGGDLYDEYLALGEVSSGSGTTTAVPVLYGKALTLDGKIGVSYYFSMEGVENPKDYYLMASVDGGTETKCELNDTEEINGVTYYYYTMYVGVADIDSTITAYLTDETSTVNLSDYSVAEYCNLAINEAWEEKALCEALLTYGYYAEIYKDGSSSISDYDDMTSYDVGDIDSTKYESSSPTGVAKALTLYDEICIKLYLTDAVVSDSATFVVNGVTYTPVADTTVSGYTYSIEIPVPAKNMDLIYTIYKSDGTTVLTTYSVYTYIMNNTSGSTTNLANLCRAIYNYSVAAENYTGWH